MPAHINYETTPILFYKFVCEDPNIKSCYVGQTTNFMNRRRQHKYSCNNIKNFNYELKIYQIIRENGGWDQWKMVEINRQICLDKVDACKVEQQYIEELQSDMNGHNAYTNRVEYQKKYRLENAEQIATYHKQHRLENKEHYQEYLKNYKLENKAQIVTYEKNRYLKNKEQISEKQKQKSNCECGGKYTYSCKSAHLKTLKHLKYCESIAHI